ncbi:URE2 [Nakaseomyces glabratus]|uniref:Protein URE2 n=2 Tax=Candida glabrata TaxID=5478 RepID=URE2_CANGA|nr:uncharacterized protein CAGL0J07392g [Nakaseomyces glabratus]Q8NJR5.2 RecName: Full=Protein URE2 [Nakaseomyces glabratus CBS 138]KAH7584125.1 Glutathione S-transferase, N-terminal domain [Nakaseomyces glabratus]KAH7597869.1 Glutathione S-transferase, N-terminal domain [Nakaseomyces glabratus]KAH7598447.1 Glutathione S-transferase, N-terminal domain [Nakaseomyces glabratus]KAH7603876.1 Glutathione S-transferase, N-terminal domain [Nakaseomyces glabratus]KAH7612163.1 Glutathione S-transferas|eukprot:XP_448028.1 uncharacterized protein CAGL0J07392g [[Candida] glabrata]
MGDSRNTGTISNLSSALRQVNIGSGQDQKNINYEFSNGLNNNVNDNGNHNLVNTNEDNVNKDGSINTNMMSRQVPIQHTHGSQLLQQERMNEQQFNPMEYSRISKFFQNQPMEGYTLFSHRSAPNGFKVSIVLSELGLQYNTIFLDFNLGEHRAPEFVSVNPNARVPALIDHGLENLAIWESGAILLHLVNKFYKETGNPLLWSDDLADQAQINAWLFFQTSGHAPMIGQALHFRYFHTQKIESAVERYTEEVRRVYGVIEMALAERREALIMELDTDNAAAYSAGTTPLSQSRFFDYPVWLVGDKLTIADLSFVPWNNVVDRIGINIKVEFPEVYKWTKHMMRRPAVIKALRGE